MEVVLYWALAYKKRPSKHLLENWRDDYFSWLYHGCNFFLDNHLPMFSKFLDVHTILQGILFERSNLQKKFVSLDSWGWASLLCFYKEDDLDNDKLVAALDDVQHVLHSFDDKFQQQYRLGKAWQDNFSGGALTRSLTRVWVRSTRHLTTLAHGSH